MSAVISKIVAQTLVTVMESDFSVTSYLLLNICTNVFVKSRYMT